MDKTIRGYIKENFKDSNAEDIEKTIDESIKEQDEVTLPGLGVLFETMWTNIDKDLKHTILDTIVNNIK